MDLWKSYTLNNDLLYITLKKKNYKITLFNNDIIICDSQLEDIYKIIYYINEPIKYSIRCINKDIKFSLYLSIY